MTANPNANGRTAVPAPTSSAEFGKILSDELARWGRVVREKNIKED